MGHDVVVIGNHRLDTSSPEKLALDLAARLNARVTFTLVFYRQSDSGWPDHFWEDKFTTLESKPNNYSLNLEFSDAEKFDPVRYYEEIDNWSSINVSDADDYDEHSFNLYKHRLRVDVYCNSRWWNFVEMIIYAENYPEILREFRLEVWQELQRYGGDKVFYFSDQGPWQAFGYWEEDNKTFEEWAERFEQEEGDRFRHLPTVLANQMPKEYQWEREVDLKDYPIFWDDFSDLKTAGLIS